MFCSNCGNKLDPKAVVCVKCGVSVVSNSVEASNAPGKGKSVASLVLGILGVLFGVIYLIAATDIDYVQQLEIASSSTYRFGYALGSVFLPLVFAIIGICLAVSARKKEKNGLNTSGFWLAISTFALAAITMIIVLAS